MATDADRPIDPPNAARDSRSARNDRDRFDWLWLFVRQDRLCGGRSSFPIKVSLVQVYVIELVPLANVFKKSFWGVLFLECLQVRPTVDFPAYIAKIYPPLSGN